MKKTKGKRFNLKDYSKKETIYIITENFITDDESQENIIGAYRSKKTAISELKKYKKKLFERKDIWEHNAKKEWDEKKEESDYEYEESETHFLINEKYNYNEKHTRVTIEKTTLS